MSTSIDKQNKHFSDKIALFYQLDEHLFDIWQCPQSSGVQMKNIDQKFAIVEKLILRLETITFFDPLQKTQISSKKMNQVQKEKNELLEIWNQIEYPNVNFEKLKQLLQSRYIVDYNNSSLLYSKNYIHF